MRRLRTTILSSISETAMQGGAKMSMEAWCNNLACINVAPLIGHWVGEYAPQPSPCWAQMIVCDKVAPMAGLAAFAAGSSQLGFRCWDLRLFVRPLRLLALTNGRRVNVRIPWRFLQKVGLFTTGHRNKTYESITSRGFMESSSAQQSCRHGHCNNGIRRSFTLSAETPSG